MSEHLRISCILTQLYKFLSWWKSFQTYLVNTTQNEVGNILSSPFPPFLPSLSVGHNSMIVSKSLVSLDVIPTLLTWNDLYISGKALASGPVLLWKMERWISIVKYVPAGQARKGLPSALQIDQWEQTCLPLFWQLQAVCCALRAPPPFHHCMFFKASALRTRKSPQNSIFFRRKNCYLILQTIDGWVYSYCKLFF